MPKGNPRVRGRSSPTGSTENTIKFYGPSASPFLLFAPEEKKLLETGKIRSGLRLYSKQCYGVLCEKMFLLVMILINLKASKESGTRLSRFA
jgi:hypothetical protein